MIVPNPPVFIVDGNDLIVHSTFDEATHWLEPADISTNDYSVYDSEGRLLHIEPDGDKVKILLAEEVPRHASELEDALRRYLRTTGSALGEDSNCDLKCLVEACKKFVIPGSQST